MLNRAADAEHEQRLVAQKREKTANEVLQLFDQFLMSADPRQTGGLDYPARQLWNKFAGDLQAMTVEDPVVEARLLLSLASAFTGLSDYKSAQVEAEKAVMLLEENLGPKNTSTLNAKLRVAQIALHDYAAKDSVRGLRQIVDLDDRSRADETDWNLLQFKAWIELAEAETRLDRLDGAQTSLNQAESKLPLMDNFAASEAKRDLMRRRRELLIAQGKLDQALPSAKEEYATALRLFGASDYRTAEAGDLLASIYLKQQRYAAAIELYENSFRISQQLFGDCHNTLLRAMRLAEASYLAEDFAAADSYFEVYHSLFGTLRRHQGRHHHSILLLWSECLCKLGKYDAAEELLHRCYFYHSKANHKTQLENCTDIRQRLFKLFRETDRDELVDHWLVPSDMPMESAAFESEDSPVRTSGKIKLVASGFVHTARAMQHHATRWQIRAADETFEYSPTLDLTSTQELQELTIPAGILLPNHKYFWRVAHVGQNRVQSEYSQEQSFQTGDLDYGFEPIDLTRYFNRDVIHSPGDDDEDAFKPITKQLVIDGYQRDLNENSFHGVPQDGRVGPHQLGDYQNHNVIQLDRQTHRVLIELPPAQLSSLRVLLAASYHGLRPGNALKATLTYADGRQEVQLVSCPDWEWKIGYPGLAPGQLPSIIVRHGLDRGFISGAVHRANNAMFDTMIPVDSSRELISISIAATAKARLNPGSRVNIFAMTGVSPIPSQGHKPSHVRPAPLASKAIVTAP